MSRIYWFCFFTVVYFHVVQEKAEHNTKKLRQSTVLKTKQNALQEKERHEIEKLRQSTTGSKVKPSEDLHCVGSPSLSNRVKKVHSHLSCLLVLLNMNLKHVTKTFSNSFLCTCISFRSFV